MKHYVSRIKYQVARITHLVSNSCTSSLDFGIRINVVCIIKMYSYSASKKSKEECVGVKGFCAPVFAVGKDDECKNEQGFIETSVLLALMALLAVTATLSSAAIVVKRCEIATSIDKSNKDTSHSLSRRFCDKDTLTRLGTDIYDTNGDIELSGGQRPEEIRAQESSDSVGSNNDSPTPSAGDAGNVSVDDASTTSTLYIKGDKGDTGEKGDKGEYQILAGDIDANIKFLQNLVTDGEKTELNSDEIQVNGEVFKISDNTTTTFSGPLYVSGSGLTVSSSTTSLFSGSTTFSLLPSIPLTAGGLLVGSASNLATPLTIGSSNQILTVSAGTPAWADLGTVLATTV